MTITVDDVKLLKSQRLTDEDDGGGRATGQAVVDREINNLFPDISRLDRTIGRINLRKAFAGISSNSAEPYLGAHAIVTRAPADPRVSVLLFNTGSQTDERRDARNAIESFVVPAVSASFELLGNQLQGQRAIACVQREEQRLPEIGEVYQLVFESRSQYVRITDVEARLEQFAHDYGNGNFVNFTRRRLDLSISAPLGATFPGGQVTPGGTTSPKSQVLSTQVADAARYYGISPLAEAVSRGALSLRVKSVYSQLVPSTTRENALVDQLAGYQRRLFAAAGPARTVNLNVANIGSGRSRTFLGTGCAPGSLSLSAGGGVFADDRKGGLRYISGSNWIASGTVDYESGAIEMAASGSGWSGTASATYQPAAAATGEDLTSQTGEQSNFSEADFFENPYSVLAEIAQQVGQQAAERVARGVERVAGRAGADGGVQVDDDVGAKLADGALGAGVGGVVETLVSTAADVEHDADAQGHGASRSRCRDTA